MTDQDEKLKNLHRAQDVLAAAGWEFCKGYWTAGDGSPPLGRMNSKIKRFGWKLRMENRYYGEARLERMR